MKNNLKVVNYVNKTSDQIRKGYELLRARYRKSVSFTTITNKGGMCSGYFEIAK